MFFLSWKIKNIRIKKVVISPLRKIMFITDILFDESMTISFTKVSFIEKDNCPNIINMMPIKPADKIYLRFIIKKNI
jgi:hypothetical protein